MDARGLVGRGAALLRPLVAGVVRPAPAAAVAAAPLAVASLFALPRQFRRGLFGQSFEVGEIQAVRRDKAGSRHAQWARQNKLIPGIIYGPDEGGRRGPVELVYVREADLRREVNKRGVCFTNTLFDIVLDGKKHRVLPRDFAVHPFKPKALCINWLRYRVGAYPGVRVDIPLKGFNQERCPAYKEGGWLMELTYKLPVFASGPAIPDYLMMDLRGMRIGDKVMASQVELNEGLRLRSRVHDFAVAKFIGSRRGADEGDAAAGGEGGAPAAGAAAAKPAAGAPAAAKPAAGGDKKA